MLYRKEKFEDSVLTTPILKYLGECVRTLIHHKIFQNTCTNTILITVSIVLTIHLFTFYYHTYEKPLQIHMK